LRERSKEAGKIEAAGGVWLVAGGQKVRRSASVIQEGITMFLGDCVWESGTLPKLETKGRRKRGLFCVRRGV